MWVSRLAEGEGKSEQWWQEKYAQWGVVNREAIMVELFAAQMAGQMAKAEKEVSKMGPVNDDSLLRSVRAQEQEIARLRERALAKQREGD